MRWKAKLWYIALGLAVGTVTGTLAGRQAGAASEKGSAYYPLTIFSKVLAHIQTSYVDDVNTDALIYGAIKGMVNSLDPHSAYLDPEEYAILQGDTSGKFGGVGIEVDARWGRLTVISPLPGSPAQKAGILPGDEIIAIDDVPAYTLTIQDAVKLMRGDPGTKVRVKVRRGETEILDFELVRQVIKLESVESEMLDPERGLGLVRVKVFQAGTYARFRDELDRLDAMVGGNLEGIVIDLRNNPGGLLDQAVYMADELLSSGIILTVQGRGGEVVHVEKAHAKGTREDFRVVLLVNEYTASASEVFAGALQDNGRAVLVGMPTFGKGSVQTIIKLPDGSGLKLTTSLYATPSGRIVQAHGIEPDLVVPAIDPSLFEKADKPTEKDIPGHLETEQAGSVPGAAPPVAIEDNQLYIAWQVLRASLGPVGGKAGPEAK